VRDWECFSNAIDARYFLAAFSFLLRLTTSSCFVAFGVANGILRRVHRYPIASLTLDRAHLGDSELDRQLQVRSPLLRELTSVRRRCLMGSIPMTKYAAPWARAGEPLSTY
jgi:hypothetical protein